MNFIFNSIILSYAANTLDLSQGDYYAHLTTARPSPINSTVAALIIPTEASYQPIDLTGRTFNQSVLDFNDFAFPSHVFPTGVTGVALCQQLAAVKANSDRLISYSDFSTLSGAVLTLNPGIFPINIMLNVLGLLRIEV
jgi:hypothetical protein